MEYLAGASGAVLGFIEGDIPGAELGYQLGKKAYKFFAKKNTTSMPPRTPTRSRRVTITPPRTPQRVSKRVIKRKPNRLNPYNRNKVSKKKGAKMRKPVPSVIVGISSGANKGKFATPGKIPKTFENTSLKLGYHLTRETIGSVTDGDCVYVYHSNYNPFQAARVLTGALLRTLFRKAGIEINNQEQEIPLLNALSSAGFRIVYTYRNPVDGVITSDNLDIVDNTALWLLIDNFMAVGKMGNLFYQYMLDNANEWKEPYTLGLYSQDLFQPGSPQYRLHSLITLQDEFVVYEAMSSIMVQNRTQGSSATATDYSADRIDNQPLKGYLYQFKNGDPRLKGSMASNTGINWNFDFLYNTGDADGVRTFGGSVLPTIGSKLMAEPPVPSIWRNLDASAKVHLEPGDIKKGVIVTTYKHRFPELLKKLRIDVSGVAAGTNPGTNYSKLPGHKSQILSLEEVLRTPSTNLVTCIYENEHKVGAYTYTQKLKGVLKSEYSTATIQQYLPPAP